MADYTEEQRVKQVYPNAQPMHFFWLKPPFWEIANGEYIVGRGSNEAEAWADASRRLGNEFVDEVGPLAERKEG